MAEIILLDKGRSPTIAADADARYMEISGRWPSHYRLAVRCYEDFGALPLGFGFARIVLVDMGRSLAIEADADARYMEISGRWPSCYRLAVWGYKDFGALPLGLSRARIVLDDKGHSPAIEADAHARHMEISGRWPSACALPELFLKIRGVALQSKQMRT
jgi:hypothetical protein